MVDTGQIKFNPAVELSYLASEEQKDFFLQWIMLKQLLPFRKHSELKSSHRRASVRWMRCARLWNEIKKGELTE